MNSNILQLDEKMFVKEISEFLEKDKKLFLILDISLINDLNLPEFPKFPKDLINTFKNRPYEKLSDSTPLLFNITKNNKWLTWFQVKKL